ncbi:MAG: hypothetical protein JSS75_11030 [Bacteroidetes bacterium]|nr:hypothetical protein [Bacteroidota bacterium]
MNHLTSHLQRAMVHDLSVMQHLLTKLPESAWDYRPRENMRSVPELLHYLSYIGSSSLAVFLAGGFVPENMSIFREARERTANLTRGDFHDAFETEKHAITEALASVTDEDLYSRPSLQAGKIEGSLLDAILNGSVKYLASYKMQLFLYAKECGAEVSTPNNWRGVDPVPTA